MKHEHWNRIGAAFSAVNDTRRHTVFRVIRDQLKEMRPENLLDYGGGDGLFVCDSTGGISGSCVVFEPSPSLFDLACENCCLSPQIQVISSTESLISSSFDVVTLNAVWMCLRSEEECQSVLREIHCLLKPGGHLIASVTHPCFRDRSFSTYRTDFDMLDYLKDGTPFEVRMGDGTSEVQISDTHWSLAAMSRQLRESGFVNAGFLELGDGQESAPGSPWLIITAEKTLIHF